MNGTIYDFQALPRLAVPLEDLTRSLGSVARTRPSPALPRVGVVTNPRSHRNKATGTSLVGRSDVLTAAPRTRADLRDVLAMFAHQAIDVLVIDGGDGTVRDVLTCAEDLWADGFPRIALLPSGKTNALGVDTGLPSDFSLDDALAAIRRGKTVERSPLEITRAGEDLPPIRGFLLGAGAFVDATALAQRTHRAGAFQGVAVGMALAWGIGQTLFGGADTQWRRGTAMRLRFDATAEGLNGVLPDEEGRRYILVSSTLQRFPLGLRPFGTPRPGMKTLVADAPPRRLAAVVPALLAGSEAAWLERAGYHRADSAGLDVELESGFILDGEIFPPGAYRVARAAPISFVVP